MAHALRTLLKTLVVPPASLFLLALVGLLLARRRPRAGHALVILAAVLLYVVSTPVAAFLLMSTLQERDPAPPAAHGAQAIVVLAGDSSAGAEYGALTVADMTLERIRYGAWLHRRHGLPVLVTGGRARPDRPDSLASLMRAALEQDFHVPVRWVEERSRNTWENARGSATILREAGIDRVMLVTHAWHMPRSRWCFETLGIDVVPAPTGFVTPPDLRPTLVLPSAPALYNSAKAIQEWIGLFWYRLRYEAGDR